MEENNTTVETTVETTQQGSEPAAETTVNYDEIIKTDKALQSWLDRRVGAATQNAVKSALEKERMLADEKVSEAEKLAKMNKEERNAYEMQKIKKELDQYKAREAANGLRTEALKIAAEQGVPTELVELIPFESVDAEAVSIKISEMKTAFESAVSAQVAKNLSGAGAPTGGQSTTAKVTESEFAKMDYAQRVALKQKDPGLYHELIKKG